MKHSWKLATILLLGSLAVVLVSSGCGNAASPISRLPAFGPLKGVTMIKKDNGTYFSLMRTRPELLIKQLDQAMPPDYDRTSVGGGRVMLDSGKLVGYEDHFFKGPDWTVAVRDYLDREENVTEVFVYKSME